MESVFDEIVEFAELGHVIDDPVKTYSSGMKVRLGFSVAANLRPNLLIMDEILAVGDVGFRMKCFGHLKNLIDNGVAIILVSHAISMLQRVATRGIVFGDGRIVHDGDLQTAGTVYEELVNVTKQEKKKDPDEDRRNQDATITRVQLCNAGGREQNDFQTGEDLFLEVEIESKKEVRGARLIVALASATYGVLSAVSTPYQNIDFNLQPGTNRITLNVRSIPLLIGAYNFNISLYGPETEDFFHRLMGQADFRISGPPINTDGRGIRGLFKMDHDWKVG